MDLETFEKELEESLEKPQDWRLANGYLMHSKTGIRMLIQAVQDSSVGVSVFSGDGTEVLFTISLAPRRCLESLKEELLRQHQQNARLAQARFLESFEGFN